MWRTYTFESVDDEDAMLLETEESRQRGGGSIDSRQADLYFLV